MADPYVDRIREDLAAMRRSLGFRQPFAWEHVWANLALALAGAVVAVLTALTGISSAPLTRGSAGHWAYIGVVIIPPLLVLAILAAVAQMIAGLVAPSITYESAGFLVDGWLMVGGLSSATVMAWQLRSRSAHVAN